MAARLPSPFFFFFPSWKTADIAWFPKAASDLLGACDLGLELPCVPPQWSIQHSCAPWVLGSLPTLSLSPCPAALLPSNFLCSPGLLHQLLQFRACTFISGVSGLEGGVPGTFLSPSTPYSSSARPEARRPGCLDNFHAFGVLYFSSVSSFFLLSLPSTLTPCVTGKGCEKPPPPRWSKQVLLKE